MRSRVLLFDLAEGADSSQFADALEELGHLEAKRGARTDAAGHLRRARSLRRTLPRDADVIR